MQAALIACLQQRAHTLRHDIHSLHLTRHAFQALHTSYLRKNEVSLASLIGELPLSQCPGSASAFGSKL